MLNLSTCAACGILVNSTATLALSDGTVSGNSADINVGAGGGGIKVEAGQVLVYNSILANNVRRRVLYPFKTNDDCKAETDNFSIYSSLVETTAGCPVPTFDNRTGVDPQLAPLANNGGATQTHALQAASPAIDPPYACAGGADAKRDQRSYVRPFDGDGDGAARCDAGAFEYGAAPP